MRKVGTLGGNAAFPRAHVRTQRVHSTRVCVIRDAHQRSCLSACGLLFVSPASSASRMPLDLRRRGPAAPGSGGHAAQCASQEPEEWSSYKLFVLCSLITKVYALINWPRAMFWPLRARLPGT